MGHIGRPRDETATSGTGAPPEAGRSASAAGGTVQALPGFDAGEAFDPWALIDDLPEGILLLDRALRVRWGNARAWELLRRGPRSAAGRPVGAAFGTEEGAELAGLCRRAVAEGRAVTAASLRLVLDGKAGPAEATAVPREDGGVALMFRDRSGTEVVREREARAGRQGTLEALAAGLAHEIRNPLAGIRGAAQLLGRGPPEDDREALVALICDEARRIEGRMAALMDLARPAVPRRGRVALNRVLHEEVRLLGAARPSVAVSLDLDPSLPEVEGDEPRLREALRNLLLNAAEAAGDAGRVRVVTRAEAHDRLDEGAGARGAAVRVVVDDDGPGVPEPLRPRIFEPFFSRRAGGTGLGLAVARKCAEEHGGSVEVGAATAGLGGARFTLRLREQLAPPTREAEA